MKPRTHLFVTAFGCFLALALVFTAPEARAQFTITTTVDENGNGTLTNTIGFNASLPSSMQADPGPGGGSSVLSYNLLNPPGLVGGDVLLIDLAGNVSDVLRFDPSIAGGTLFFYSLLGGAQLADTGLPGAFNTNLVRILENLTTFTLYMPTAGQPGFVAGAAGPVTYRFLSPEALPETGGTLILLGVATIIVLVVQRRHARA
jgi:hypothetical protein